MTGGGHSPGHMGQLGIGADGGGSGQNIWLSSHGGSGGHSGGGGQSCAAAKPSRSVESRSIILTGDQLMDS